VTWPSVDKLQGFKLGLEIVLLLLLVPLILYHIIKGDPKRALETTVHRP
jgi:hypothetical protein